MDRIHKLIEVASSFQQLMVPSFFYYLPLLHHHNLVAMLHSRQSMSYHDLSHALNSLYCFLSLFIIYLHHFLVLIVQCWCRLVQNDHWWIPHQCPCNCYSLFLPTWQIWSPRAYFLIKCLYFYRISTFDLRPHLFFSLRFFFLFIFADFCLVLVLHSEIALDNKIKSLSHFTSLNYILKCSILAVIFNIFINWSIEQCGLLGDDAKLFS